MISIQNVAVLFGADVLFEEVSFLINRTDRIGLAGRNGAGKSTLLKIIKGINKPTLGTVAVPRDATIGYLPQEFQNNSSLTVIEETRKAFERVLELEKQINHLNEQLSTRTDYESDGYMKLIEDLNDAQHHFQVLGGYEMEEKVERILKGLGFDQADFTRKVSEFSGGWQMRIELAKILLQQPDLILLDEPTNHLDIESIIWLEDFLVNYPGAIMMISHDKTFLDKITNRTIEITNGTIQDYKAAYSKYLELRKERREKLENAVKNQERQIAQMERNIERFRAKASKASFAQSLMKKLDKIERIEMDPEDVTKINIRFPDSPRSGKVVVTAENVAKSYGDRQIIRPMTFTVDAGDRIAFVGKNGMGKTTLSRIIAKNLDGDGKLEYGHNVHLGYFAQHQTHTLNGENTILAEMEEAAQLSNQFTQVRAILGAFLFSGEDVDKKIKVLSGGEKSRLAMAKLLLEPLNLLILDEPTNHLDIVSKEVLKNALMKYEGTLIVVSHDRDFLKGLTKKVFEFTPDGIKEHLGDITEFLQKRNAENFREFELNKEKKAAEPEPVKSATNEDHEKKKFIEKETRRVKNAIQASEKKIAELEAKLKEMDDRLQSPEEYKKLAGDKTFFDSYDTLKNNLDREMQHWERLLMEMESIQA